MKYVLVEALLKGTGIEDNSPEMAQVQHICGFQRVPLKEIPVENYVQMLDWLAAHFYPALARPAGLLQVGVDFYKGYKLTILGRVQLATFQMMGPDRLVQKFPEFATNNTNFGERWTEQRGLHDYMMAYRGIPLQPEYTLGIFKGALADYDIVQPNLEYKQIGPEDYDYIIAWE